MGFLKNLFKGEPAKPEKRYYVFQVKCNRCLEFEDNHNVYFGRKVLMGGGHCFQQIEVEMKFTSSRELIEKEVQGGIFVE